VLLKSAIWRAAVEIRGQTERFNGFCAKDTGFCSSVAATMARLARVVRGKLPIMCRSARKRMADEGRPLLSFGP
jgi:hypothetical protein